MDRLQEAKRRLPIPELWKRLGLPGECRRVCKTPWREDRKPSMSISKDGMLWKDFGEDTGGDAVCFIERACGLSRKAACLKLIEMAGCQNITAPLVAQRVAPVSYKPRARPVMPALKVGTDDQNRRLAALRGVSEAAVVKMAERGLLYFCEYHGRECWLITDRDKINAQVRRLDGGKWGEVKALTLPNSWAKWPIGIGTAGANILLVEGGPDLLAACEAILAEKLDCSPVCMFGAALEIHPAAVPLFYRKRVCIVPHNDEAGGKAAAKWMKQIQGEIRPLPAAVKDLNDLVKLPLETRQGVVWPSEPSGAPTPGRVVGGQTK